MYAVLAEVGDDPDRPWCFTDVMRHCQTYAIARVEALYWLAAQFHVAIYAEGTIAGTAFPLWDSWDSNEDEDGPPDHA